VLSQKHVTIVAEAETIQLAMRHVLIGEQWR